MSIKDFIDQKLKEIGEIEEENQIATIVTEVKETFNTKCNYFYAGSYETSDDENDFFSITTFFFISYIDENGELQGTHTEIEKVY